MAALYVLVIQNQLALLQHARSHLCGRGLGAPLWVEVVNSAGYFARLYVLVGLY
jgi:hypothetical protein